MNRKHGVTGPLSSRLSSELAICKSELLSSFLHSSQFYESLSDSQTRERALGVLHHVAKTHFNGRLHTFGSYRLGVHQKNSDIDTLLIVPRKYTHCDFFSTFYESLSALDGVSELHKVEDAYVPLIKLKLFDISIDLVFARTGLVSVEKLDLLDDALLKDMDDKSIISINGSRVTDMLIELVPDRGVFHTALRCIKYWAKRRGIYGNAYGYFGGVAYAISVARICQFYPNGCAFTIVSKFFDLYSNWEWPSPVVLCTAVNRNYGLRVWDPKINYADRFHKMPVITPAYPAMCSTHNVGLSTMALMMEEFKRGSEILKKGKEIDVLFIKKDGTGVSTNNAHDDVKSINSKTNLDKIIAKEEKSNENNNQVNLVESKTDQIINEENNNQVNLVESKTDQIINEENNNQVNLVESKTDQIINEENNNQVNLVESKTDQIINEENKNLEQILLESNKDPIPIVNKNDPNPNLDQFVIKEEKVVQVNLPSPISSTSPTLKDDINPNKCFKAEFINILKLLTLQTHFFKAYKSYLQIKVPDNNTWSSYVESRIRHLCIKLETTEQYATAVTVQAFPYPSGFQTCEGENKFVNFFIGLKYESKIKVNIDKPVREFKQAVLEWERNEKWGMDVMLIKKKEMGAFLKVYYDQREVYKVENVKRQKIEAVKC